MGYRSDVAVTILFETLDAAKLFVAKVRAAQPEPVRKALEEYSIHVHDDGVTVLHGYYESVKWYRDMFEDVQAHHTLLGLAEDAGAGWRFIRIGEDADDNEDENHVPAGALWCNDHIWDDSDMVRTVAVNLPPARANGKYLQAIDLPEWTFDNDNDNEE